MKERRGGLWVPVMRRKNVVTNYGKTQLASAWGGAFLAPQYLVIDRNTAILQNSPSIGGNLVQTDIRIDLVGDTQIIVGLGAASQETVTFSSVTGAGPYNYNLSTLLTKNHTAGEMVVRVPLAADTMSSVISEGQYDATNFPNQRIQAATGYSAGTGNWTAQFFATGTQAQFKFVTLGTSENGTVGAGNLHNHVVLGYDHSATTNDLEIDVSLTLS